MILEAQDKNMIKQFSTLVMLVFIPVLVSAFYATSFLDEIPFYYDFFGIALVICGILYLIAGSFLRKRRFKLFMYVLFIGGALVLVGIILFIYFYGYAFSTPETIGGWYF